MKKFILIIFPAILFAGCLNLEIETFLGADGSGSSIIHYWTHLDALYKDTSYSNKFSFKENVIRKNFSSENVEIKSIKIWQKKEDTTYHAEIKIVFDDINNLSNSEFFNDYSFRFNDGAPGQKIFEQRIKSFDFAFSDSKKYSVKYIYHFPGPIITDNAREKRENTLIWQFSLDQLTSDKTLTATIKIPVNSKLGYLIPVLILLLLFLWYVLIKRRRKRSEDEGG
jgi:hypothetical protein